MALDCSLLVLARIFDEGLLDLTKKCIASLKGQGDEIILIDGGSPIVYKPEGVRIIRLETDPGFTACINMGIDLAQGSHIVFISNDTEVTAGNLRDMCKDGLTFPTVNWVPPEYRPDEWHGGFYGFPNDPFFKHSTDYHYYYTDTDLFERARRAKIPFYRVPSVVINHKVNSTTNKTGGRKWYAADKEIFRQKYGYADD